MDINKISEKKYAEAKAKVERIKMFYIHLLGYIVASGFILYNSLTIEEGHKFEDSVLAINVSSLVIWGIVIIVHGWSAFKGRILFSKKWEERKVKEYMNNDKQN
jgi:hypothetical protein